MQNFLPPYQYQRGTPCHAESRATAVAGWILGICALPPSAAPRLGMMLLAETLHSASSLCLLRAAELNAEENQAERGFCRGLAPLLWHWHPVLQPPGNHHMPAVTWAELTASPGSFLAPTTSALAAFADFRTSCSRWYPWRGSPKPLPSPLCLLLGSSSPSNKTRAKPGCFLKAAGPATGLSAQPWMLNSCMKRKYRFSTHWGHQLMFVQLQ